MVVLGYCLILVLATATLGQEQEFDKIIKNLDKLVQEKKHNEVVKEKLTEKFANLGKFRQAVIGSQLKYGQRPVGIPSPPSPPPPHGVTTKGPAYKASNQVLERFRAFKQQKTSKVKEADSAPAGNASEDEKTRETTNSAEAEDKNEDTAKHVVEQLHNLVTTTGEQKTTPPGASPSVAASTEVTQGTVPPAPLPSQAEVPSQAVVPNQAVVPSPLGLTSDTHQKRSGIHDLPEGDGMFLVVVMCVAVCCILGVVGVGYCVHHPTCHRSTSPFSDASPSFHSAQLAFSASPEDKPGVRQGQGQHSGQTRSDGPAETHSWQDVRSSPASRAYKFRSGAGGGQETGGERRHGGVQRMESLIDIGPEEDDEDDMIYECPGLAPHGEMEVTNPFFLSKGLDMDLEGIEIGKMELPPCPVNINNNMRHGNIHRNIQPGQQ